MMSSQNVTINVRLDKRVCKIDVDNGIMNCEDIWGRESPFHESSQRLQSSAVLRH